MERAERRTSGKRKRRSSQPKSLTPKSPTRSSTHLSPNQRISPRRKSRRVASSKGTSKASIKASSKASIKALKSRTRYVTSSKPQKEYTSMINSYIVNSLVLLLGYDDTRYDVLMYKLKNPKGFTYGNTFSYIEDKKEVKDYLENVLDKEKNGIVIFTATNPVSIKNLETHYQSFIIDNPQKKLFIIDPAYFMDTELEAYHRKITKDVILPHYESLGFEPIYIDNYCQLTSRDVYCQTWSLILLIKILNKGLNRIPKDLYKEFTTQEKKSELYHFFSDIIKNLPNVCKRLKEIYKELIQSVEGENKKILEKINICEYFLNVFTEKNI
jgi:hypothetical protein